MQYQINISIDQQSLQQMRMAGENVALVKRVGSNPPSSAPVIWAAFQPLMANTVAWTDSQALYATQTQIMAGATISMSMIFDADVGSAYVFSPSAQFANVGSGAAGAISLDNQSAQWRNFGLAQLATVSGVSQMGPTNVVSVYQNMNTAFVPSETVSLFLSQMSQNGQVLSNIPGNALTMTLSSASPVANVVYDSGSGRFVRQQ